MPYQQRRFADKVAFVTGAGGGIGRATALAFAREGASVVVADVDEQVNTETARLIEADGGRVIAVHCDVTRAQDVQAAMDTAVKTFGGLDVAFNNAGIEQSTASAADITEEDWDRVIAVNLRTVCAGSSKTSRPPSFVAVPRSTQPRHRRTSSWTCTPLSTSCPWGATR